MKSLIQILVHIFRVGAEWLRPLDILIFCDVHQDCAPLSVYAGTLDELQSLIVLSRGRVRGFACRGYLSLASYFHPPFTTFCYLHRLLWGSESPSYCLFFNIDILAFHSSIYCMLSERFLANDIVKWMLLVLYCRDIMTTFSSRSMILNAFFVNQFR